jgi:hypothetical protein
MYALFSPNSSYFVFLYWPSEQTIIPQLVLGPSLKWPVMAG